MDNYDYANNGRIWVLWDRSFVKFKAMTVHDQLIHGYREGVNDGFTSLYTMLMTGKEGNIYGKN